MSNRASSDNSWSIALHGGAGSGPASWPESLREARKRGVQTALELGRRLLAEGATALEVVERVVMSLEDDGHFHAGRGASRNAAGQVELDAAIMDGVDARCGAVAGISLTPNAISVARHVMQATKHVMLVGENANAFAREQGFQTVDPSSFVHHSEKGDVRMGTVGCVARDQFGNLAVATSTSGTSNKRPGRVGDSPIIGAGTFAANAYGAVSATGIGEEFMRRCVAYDLIAQVRYANRTLAQAARDMMLTRLPDATGGLVAIDANGDIVLEHNTPGMSWGAANSQGRFETGLAVERA